MKKICYYSCIILTIICLLYAIINNNKLNAINNSQNIKQETIVTDHLLSLSLVEEFDGYKILQSEYPSIAIQDIIDGLEVADISFMYLFEADRISVSAVYRRYIYILEQYRLEQIKTGTIEDKEDFNNILKDIKIIKNWLESRYHDKNYEPYKYEELKGAIFDDLNIKFEQ
ncbi:hypothetical protein SH1V18_04870 [Vallitalea longa]|uniref:Uncharacterized protein n=1 Tax=Vallitalea longa TaxID=2936439 RepID=A0A9W6DE45_9FIRM|nr:hypothetical protein [Vallitalea longa]GKX28007.1 hypothetical protein SH1V18_04870 [Vallitalea longa]